VYWKKIHWDALYLTPPQPSSIEIPPDFGDVFFVAQALFVVMVKHGAEDQGLATDELVQEPGVTQL